MCTAGAVLVAVPSLWPEPFGLVGLDAAALGRPAIAFDVGGIGEWLTDGVNGKLVEPAAGEEGLARRIGGPAWQRRRARADGSERVRCLSPDVRSRRTSSASNRSSARSGVDVAMAHWTMLTCEYPPGCGGVGDYTAQVAAALAAAGDSVTVVCPPKPVSGAREASQAAAEAVGVELLMLDDTYGRLGRRAIDERLDRGAPTTILVRSRTDGVWPSWRQYPVVPLAPRSRAPPRQ